MKNIEELFLVGENRFYDIVDAMRYARHHGIKTIHKITMFMHGGEVEDEWHETITL
jgi:hypothetical protein